MSSDGEEDAVVVLKGLFADSDVESKDEECDEDSTVEEVEAGHDEVNEDIEDIALSNWETKRRANRSPVLTKESKAFISPMSPAITNV